MYINPCYAAQISFIFPNSLHTRGSEVTNLKRKWPFCYEPNFDNTSSISVECDNAARIVFPQRKNCTAFLIGYELTNSKYFQLIL